MLWGTAPLVSGLVVYAVGPRISRNVAQQVRTYAFFRLRSVKNFSKRTFSRRVVSDNRIRRFLAFTLRTFHNVTASYAAASVVRRRLSL